jgi:hypothetical protein
MAQQALKLKTITQLRQVMRASSSGKTGATATNITNFGKDMLLVLRYLPANVINRIQHGIGMAQSQETKTDGPTQKEGAEGSEGQDNDKRIENNTSLVNASKSSPPENESSPVPKPITSSTSSPKLLEGSGIPEGVDPPIEPDEPLGTGIHDMSGNMNWQHLEARTRYLVSVLQKNVGVATPHNLVHHVESLFLHIYQFHETRNTAVECGAVKVLNKVIKLHEGEVYIVNRTRELLAILGQNPPLKGRGIRVLSIDGGGVRYDLNLNYHFYSNQRSR